MKYMKTFTERNEHLENKNLIFDSTKDLLDNFYNKKIDIFNENTLVLNNEIFTINTDSKIDNNSLYEFIKSNDVKRIMFHNSNKTKTIFFNFIIEKLKNNYYFKPFSVENNFIMENTKKQKYFLFNFDETKEIYLGEFFNDHDAWEIGYEKIKDYNKKHKKEIWHLESF